MTESDELSADLHREEAKSLADRLGWVHKHDEHELADQYDGVPFGWGEHRRVHNVIRANHKGRDITAFDYRFMVFHDHNVDTSDRNARHHYLIVVVPLQKPVPPLSASEGHYPHWEPKGDRVAVRHDRFGDHYDVYGADQAFADAVLEEEWMTGCLKRMRRTEWRFDGDVLIAWAKDQNVGNHLEELLDILIPLAEAAERAAASS